MHQFHMQIFLRIEENETRGNREGGREGGRGSNCTVMPHLMSGNILQINLELKKERESRKISLGYKATGEKSFKD